jgi:hypothetical protein
VIGLQHQIDRCALVLASKYFLVRLASTPSSLIVGHVGGSENSDEIPEHKSAGIQER